MYKKKFAMSEAHHTQCGAHNITLGRQWTGSLVARDKLEQVSTGHYS